MSKSMKLKKKKNFIKCVKNPINYNLKKSPLPIFWSLHVSVNLFFIEETRREYKVTSKKKALAYVVTVS